MQVGLLIFYNRLEDGTGQYHGYAFWPAPVVAALQETMVLEQVQAGYYLYVPEMPGAKVTRPEGSSRLCAD